ncbi:hypothetical protein PRIPAC_91066 [Pristionchus pacificus]|uniref:Uncharacterized protein n=1 Tax=Pristionchus pacificus TaxID=54126 RepID=A0A8R1YT33_PRIPA|nr:hypothetical protein PRIPAC_91066 [Pristionchus pacificus]|eukprot:PDM82340.1 hypothetical protein PRIPAC_36733 [Pristionchus pacificus]
MRNEAGTSHFDGGSSSQCDMMGHGYPITLSKLPCFQFSFELRYEHLAVCQMSLKDRQRARDYVEVDVRVNGKLTCKGSFDYRVKLWEEDKSNHDFLDEDKARGATDEGYYSVFGKAYDGWFESHVEPFMTIEHTCGTSHPVCFCYFFPQTSTQIATTKNINLQRHKYTRCAGCDQAEAITYEQTKNEKAAFADEP